MSIQSSVGLSPATPFGDPVVVDENVDLTDRLGDILRALVRSDVPRYGMGVMALFSNRSCNGLRRVDLETMDPDRRALARKYACETGSRAAIAARDERSLSAEFKIHIASPPSSRRMLPGMNQQRARTSSIRLVAD